MQRHKFNSRPVMLAALVAMATQTFSQSQSISVMLNGQPVSFDYARPIEINGHILIPVRGVLEQLGAVVDWDQSSQTVHATRQNLTVDLRLGDRNARVNGRDVALDVPAQYLNGSTMVPLRFMSEALGASVDWSNATRTVSINTPSGQSVIYNPPQPIPNPPNYGNMAAISSFSADRDGFLKPGTRVLFTLNGTQGGQASLEIPGIADNIPMRETNPGTYETQWTVPRSSRGVSMSDVTAVAHLSVNGSEKLAESGQAFSIDATPPRVTGLRPPAEGFVANARPLIGAQLSDGAGSGIDSNNVRFTLDGRELTGSTQLMKNQVSYMPTRNLEPGSHQVVVMAQDLAGNQTTRQWSFQVADRPSRDRVLDYVAPQDWSQGNVQFTLDAEPGANASLALGDMGRTIPMREANPGHYIARYNIRLGEDLSTRVIRARVRPSGGGDYWVEVARPIPAIRGQRIQPAFISPREGAMTQNPLVLRGRAAPYSDVQLHIVSTSSVLNAFKYRRTVGDYTVSADADGNWSTTKIDLGRSLGSNIQITVTAYTMDSSGQKSPVSTLHLSQ